MFSDIVVPSIPKPADQRPEILLLVPGVVHEPLEHKFGRTKIESVLDHQLVSLGSAHAVHRSRRHHTVAANPSVQSVLLDQVRFPVRFQHFPRSNLLMV